MQYIIHVELIFINQIKSVMEKISLKAMKALLMCLVLGMVPFCLASCGSDDDDEGTGTFNPPAFESQAAKYEISDDGSSYESIEFTESGNYIITMNDGGQPAYAPLASVGKESVSGKLAELVKSSIVVNAGSKHATRVYSPILYGTYTVGADGVYNLDGFGTVKVTQDGSGNAFSLEITPNGGSTETITATKQNENFNSSKSLMLCRTWQISECQLFVKLNGRKMLDIKGNSREELVDNLIDWARKNDPEFSEDDYSDLDDLDDIVGGWPEQVVFTKTGTYMVYYTEDQLAVSTWRWADEDAGVMQYSWTNDFESGYGGGYVDIDFRGGRLYMTESDTEVDEGYTTESGMTYVLTEVK